MKKTVNYFLIIATIVALIYGCEKSDSGSSDTSSSGKGGSLARFTIAGNQLYTVDSRNLNIFNLDNPAAPGKISSKSVGFNIETIFAYQNTLYMGSQNGMYIYDISIPDEPQYKTCYQHIYSCDPVVANDTVAYVTLHTESMCGRNTNELQVVDVRDKKNPKFVKSIGMTQPRGLGMEGKTLFVCDNGLKVYSISSLFQPVYLKKFNIPAIDVIPNNNLLLVMASDGLHQYTFDNDTIYHLSKIQ